MVLMEKKSVRVEKGPTYIQAEGKNNVQRPTPSFWLFLLNTHMLQNSRETWSLMTHFFLAQYCLLSLPDLMSNPTLIPSKYVDSNNASWHRSFGYCCIFFDKMRILLYPAETNSKKKISKYQYQFIKPVRLVTCCCQP